MHKNAHTHTRLVSCGKQSEEAVACLCADLMSFNSLAPGPGAGQSWAKAKTGPDHLWRQEKPRAQWVNVCVALCDVCVLPIFPSPLPSFSLFQPLYMCAHEVCETPRWWKLQGTETAAAWITLDKAIDRGIKVTIEYLQHAELIHSAA